MTDPAALLAGVKTVLLIDWPSREVPDTLARRGFTVVAAEGPGTYTAYEVSGDEVLARRVEGPPEQVDLVYAHRPVAELNDIVETAHSLGARAVWVQSGRDPGGARDPHGCWLTPEESTRARAIVESAGLAYVETPYIADAVR